MDSSQFVELRVGSLAALDARVARAQRVNNKLIYRIRRSGEGFLCRDYSLSRSLVAHISMATTSPARPRNASSSSTSGLALPARSPRYRFMSTSGCSDDRAVVVSGLPPAFASELYPFVLQFLEAVCGPILAHSLSADGTYVAVTFSLAAAADIASSLPPQASSLFPSPVPLPPLTIERRKADPKALAPSSPIIVLKNLAYDLTAAVLQAYLEGLPGVPAPLSVDLSLENGRRFLGVAFATYRSIDDAAQVMQAVHGSSFAGRTVKAEYKRVKLQGGSTPSPASFGSPHRTAEGSPSAAAAFSLAGMAGLSVADVPFLSLHDPLPPAMQLAAAIEDAVSASCGRDVLDGAAPGPLSSPYMGSPGFHRAYAGAALLPASGSRPIAAAPAAAGAAVGAAPASPALTSTSAATPVPRLRAQSKEFTPAAASASGGGGSGGGGSGQMFGSMAFAAAEAGGRREVFSLSPIVEHEGESSAALRSLRVPAIRVVQGGGGGGSNSGGGGRGGAPTGSAAGASARTASPASSRESCGGEDEHERDSSPAEAAEGSSGAAQLQAQPPSSKKKKPKKKKAVVAGGAPAVLSATAAVFIGGKQREGSIASVSEAEGGGGGSGSAGGGGGGAGGGSSSSSSGSNNNYQLRPFDGLSWRQREAAKGATSAAASASTGDQSQQPHHQSPSSSAASSSPTLEASPHSSHVGGRGTGRSASPPTLPLHPHPSSSASPHAHRELSASGKEALSAAIAALELPSSTNVRYSRGPTVGAGFHRERGMTGGEAPPAAAPAEDNV